MPKFWLSLTLASACVAPLFGGEYAVLATGFRLRAERHESSGATVRLYTKDGVTELPASAVAGFEADDYVPPPAALATTPALAPAVQRDPRELVHDAALHEGLPPALVESVALIESGFNPTAISRKGAIGVMQLMPETARQLDADPRNPEQNIAAGARLLRDLLLKYDGDVVKALAAYNAGSGAVDRYRGLPPYAETQDYVGKVVRSYIRAGGK